MRAGTVYLVGAGPGDPALISLRGRRYLASADVVVHDHLVHPRLLRVAPAHAERLDVGSASPQPLAQEAINLLLAEKAREQKIVVRLKWGDPFLFDSGGKEALFLHEQRIPFEIVPGVTPAVAAPSYAGIPVTYPGAGDTVVFVRSPDDPKKPHRIDWEAIARLTGTVVCCGGRRQLVSMADALLSHGANPGESAAAILDGTLPQQQTLDGTLADVRSALDRHEAPRQQSGVLVVGRVAGLRSHLRWFDERPLFGKRVLVTRPREQAGELIEQLEDLGAEAIEAPSVQIVPPSDFGPLDEACASAGSYDWIVFTTGTAVDWFMRRLLDGPRDTRSLAGPVLCAIGPATADRLARFGVKADLTSTEFKGDAVIEAMRARRTVAGARVLLPRSDGTRDLIADELRRAGAVVTDVPAYRALQQPLHADADQDIYKMLLEREIQIVIFTSASTVRAFASLIGEEQAADLLRPTVVACIGPVTADAARRLGILPTVVPREYTIPALVHALVEHYTAAASQTA